jgi:hypothetical protein
MTHFDFSSLNIWAILVASILNMAIGFVWFSMALFGKPWMAGLGFKVEDLKPEPKLYIITYILGLFMAVVMALFLQGVDNVVHGLAYGGILALGFVIPTLVTHYLYEMRKGKLIFIIAGHVFVVFLVYGALLGAWQ